MELKEQNLGEELYNLLAELLNSKIFVENTGFCAIFVILRIMCMPVS